MEADGVVRSVIETETGEPGEHDPGASLGGLFERDIEEEDQVETIEATAQAASGEPELEEGAAGGDADADATAANGEGGDVTSVDDEDGGDVDEAEIHHVDAAASVATDAPRGNDAAVPRRRRPSLRPRRMSGGGAAAAETHGANDERDRGEDEGEQSDSDIDDEVPGSNPGGGGDAAQKTFGSDLDEDTIARVLGDAAAAAKLAEFKSFKDELYVVRGKNVGVGHNGRKKRRNKEGSVGEILASYRPKTAQVPVALSYEELTGLSIIGGADAWKAKSEALKAARYTTKAEALASLKQLDKEGAVWEGGFKGSRMNDLGPADRGHDAHPTTPGAKRCKSASCGSFGVCTSGGKCACTLSFKTGYGATCSAPVKFPMGMSSRFTGSFVLNRRKLLETAGLFTVYQSRPLKSGAPGTRFSFSAAPDLLKATPSADIFRGGLAGVIERKYRTCAVVGNSGLVLRYKHGSRIDEHDAVIRLNDAPTIGFEEHVGAKTTFRLVNVNKARFVEGDEIVIMQVQSKAGLLVYNALRAENPSSRLFAFDTDFSAYVNLNVPKMPSVDMFGLFLAIQRCASVTLFGFAREPGYGVKRNYFNDADVRLTAAASAAAAAGTGMEAADEAARASKEARTSEKIHDYDDEWRRVVAFARDGIVSIAEPCVAGCPREVGFAGKYSSPGGHCLCTSPGGDTEDVNLFIAGGGGFRRDLVVPLPVALPGFCRPPRNHSCYLKCPKGSKECPGSALLPQPWEAETAKEGGGVEEVEHVKQHGGQVMSRVEGGRVIGGDEPFDGVKGDCHPNMVQRLRNRDKSYVCATPMDVDSEGLGAKPSGVTIKNRGKTKGGTSWVTVG